MADLKLRGSQTDHIQKYLMRVDLFETVYFPLSPFLISPVHTKEFIKVPKQNDPFYWILPNVGSDFLD